MLGKKIFVVASKQVNIKKCLILIMLTNTINDFYSRTFTFPKKKKKNALKNDENTFYFSLKALSILEIFTFLS